MSTSQKIFFAHVRRIENRYEIFGNKFLIHGYSLQVEFYLVGIGVEVRNIDVVKGSNLYSGECEMKNTEEINLNCKAFELYSGGN